MGGNNTKPRDPREDIEDAMLEMRMTAKQFENASRRAQRDQKKEIDKARAVIFSFFSQTFLKLFRL